LIISLFINLARNTPIAQTLKSGKPMRGWMSSDAPSVPAKRARGTALTIGAVFTLAAGALSLINGFNGIIFEGEFLFMEWDPGFSRFALCGIICILFGIIAIAGGIMALRTRRISLAFAGALLGMMGGGLVGFWLGLAAVIVFAFSDSDF